MNELVYIHGLGSDRNSRKFKIIEESLGNIYKCHFAFWDKNTDFLQFFNDLISKYDKVSNLVIIGDSTGGNYAHQFRSMLGKTNNSIKLVLLNPLLDVSNRIADFPFPKELLNSLQTITTVNDCFILRSRFDEVIDQNKVKIGENVESIFVDDSHRILRFQEFIPLINRYIVNKS